ncbi:MAG: hypothetical protein DRN99_09100 [Thermoproteota archaeon]|nr:MAG: hypothetical protein DRN99_09100 [Candidatus Korarchaeota archaeon]
MLIVDEEQAELEEELAEYYILDTIAHNIMLAERGIIPEQDAARVIKALLALLEEARGGRLKVKVGMDIHQVVEAKLREAAGASSLWFHQARSRNDEVAARMRMYIRHKLVSLALRALSCCAEMLDLSEKYCSLVMPGYTHQMPSMPMTFGFWLQCYAEGILDTMELAKAAYKAADKCPLGAGASQGVYWPIDRELTSRLLGFSKPVLNSLYAVTSRGHIELYAASWASALALLLSRLAEDLVNWSSLGLVEVKAGEGSSIIPAKLNPDVAELLRAASARTLACYTHMYTALKSLPSGYQRDSRETKKPIVDCFKALEYSLKALSALLRSARPLPEEMYTRAQSCMLAAKAAKLARQLNKPYAEVKKLIEEGEASLPEVNPDEALEMQDHLGSPKPARVLEAARELRKAVQQEASWWHARERGMLEAERDLIERAKLYAQRAAEASPRW